MSIIKSLVLGAAATYAVSSFASVLPVGTYKAHLNITALPSATAAQKQKLAEQVTRFAALKLVLTLKPDHTYTSTTNGPKKFPTQVGKWSFSGSKVTLTSPPHPGSQSFTYTKDGRSLILQLPAANGVTGQLVFSK